MVLEGDLAPTRNIVGSLADRLYVTWGWNVGLDNVTLYLWEVEKGLYPTAPTLLDSLSLGYFNVQHRAENDSGTIGIVGQDMDWNRQLIHITAPDRALIIRRIPVLQDGQILRMCVSGDGLEFLLEVEVMNQ
jgi:hypothetical protein